MQSANPLLPGVGFDVERLLPPRQALVAFLARVSLSPPRLEHVALEDAFGRILAEAIAADDDYPAARRSVMDGFALAASRAPGTFEIAGDVRMGEALQGRDEDRLAWRIPTGGVLPDGTDAVVPIEDARASGDTVAIDAAVAPGENVVERGADMRAGEMLLEPHRRIRAPEMGVLATLGVTRVPVFSRPVVAVFSSGDELVDVSARPKLGEIRDSNRYAVAASLRAMGAQPRHYPTLRDEAGDFESALAAALDECDAVVVTGGSSVGDRDRLPRAVAAIADPGVVVHGMRLKPGKPTLFGAHGGKLIVGLPGNPTSALIVLEAVAAPLIAALTGASIIAPTLQARLAEPAQSRADWTWYVPVRLRDDGGLHFAYPLALRSFSVSLTARADGYLVMEERDERWPAETLVTVHRFLGSP
jgi:molybdenum cofactor synthesis domain-containing protein